MGALTNDTRIDNVLDTVSKKKLADTKIIGIDNEEATVADNEPAEAGNSKQTGNYKKAFVAVLRSKADGNVLLSRKEQAGRLAEREKQCRETKSKIDNILSKMTEQDYKALEEEGFPVDNFTVEGLEAALVRIKAGQQDGRKAASPEQIQAKPAGAVKAGSQAAVTEKTIKEKLAEANLPVTKDAVSKITAALSLSDEYTALDDNAIKQLIANNMAPTIENIYKAQHQSSAPVNTDTISDKAWQELMPQVTEVINSAGFKVNTESLDSAKWLVENELPLTKENFIYLNELKDIKPDNDKNLVLDKIIEGMENGTAPKDVILIPESALPYNKIINDIGSIDDEALKQAVISGRELTINNLKELGYVTAQPKAPDTPADEEESGQPSSDTLTEDQQYKLIKAQRQLEEIRLKMTVEAASRLEKQGIHIETEPLERVVEELKNLEDSYYKRMLEEADVQPDTEKVEALKAASESVEQLKMVPSFVLGRTLPERSVETVTTLLEAGNKLLADINKAKEAYETLMTVPSKEYGDSIQKAFNNDETLLKELGIEDTKANQRAVRILGYNSMELNKENIEQVKAYDLEVNNLFNNLKPSVTVRLIKEGINPLDMPIGELNKTIDKLMAEQGSSEVDKFSTYLRKLEKDSKISDKERKAYIGIYRLLHNIEKTDGAALGAVVKADQEVTLNHLLTAVRTIHKGKLDAAVNDEFGTLQNITRDKETISEQLESVFKEGTGDTSADLNGQQTGGGSQTNSEYLDMVLNSLYKEASPEKLKELHLSTGFKLLFSSDRGIWDTIKDVPVDTLYEKLKSSEANDAAADPVYYEKLKEMGEIYKNSEHAVRFLEDFKVPSSAVNVLLAGQILNNGGTLFKKLFKLNGENNDENVKKSLKKMSELSDTLIDRNSANETYAELGNSVNEFTAAELGEGKLDAKRLAELKSISIQMSLAKTLADKEFYQIPVETQNGITNVNLTIIRGKSETGKVTVSVTSEQLGRVKAEVSLKDSVVTGYVACDSRAGLDKLKSAVKEMDPVYKENKLTVKQMDICFQKLTGDTYTYQNPGEKTGEANQETERLLYRIAKGLIRTIRAAENN